MAMFVDAPEYDPTGTYGGGMMDMGVSDQGLGPPNLTLAGVALLAIGLRFLTDSNFVTFDTSELKISLFNVLAVWVMYKTANAVVLLSASWLASKGVNIPGLAPVIAL
jgi:hypothetical protein